MTANRVMNWLDHYQRIRRNDLVSSLLNTLYINNEPSQMHRIADLYQRFGSSRVRKCAHHFRKSGFYKAKADGGHELTEHGFYVMWNRTKQLQRYAKRTRHSPYKNNRRDFNLEKRQGKRV